MIRTALLLLRKDRDIPGNLENLIRSLYAGGSIGGPSCPHARHRSWRGRFSSYARASGTKGGGHPAEIHESSDVLRLDSPLGRRVASQTFALSYDGSGRPDGSGRVALLHFPHPAGSSPAGRHPGQSRAPSAQPVRNSLPARRSGRCSGVNVWAVHIPCRSGWPSRCTGHSPTVCRARLRLTAASTTLKTSMMRFIG